MHANVSAMVGPHGGAWYTSWWAARDTLLLEFLPKNRLVVMIWEEGSVIGLRYWVLPCESAEPDHNMQARTSSAARDG